MTGDVPQTEPAAERFNQDWLENAINGVTERDFWARSLRETTERAEAAEAALAEAHRCDALCRDVEDERDRLLADAERARPVVEAAKALRAAQRRDVIQRPITVHDLFGRVEEFRAIREAFAAAVDAYEEQERGTDA